MAKGARRGLSALAMAIVVAVQPLAVDAGLAQHGGGSRKVNKPPVILPTPPTAPATPAPPPETKAYDPQLLRLAEILGALTYLRGVCGDDDSDSWRARMQALLDAEGVPAVRRDRLAGSFNRGLHGYERSYRACTLNARVIIDRFLAEGAKLAQDIENRYRSS